MLKIILSILAAFLTAASFMPLIRKDDWWIRVFDFPRSQIVVLGLIVLIAGLFVWNLRSPVQAILAGLLTLGIGYEISTILPYTVVAPTQVLASSRNEPDSTLSLLVANVLMSNRETERLKDIIHDLDPDLVLLLEPDTWWEEQMRVLEDTYTTTLKKPLDNRYGMLLYSRLPLVDPKIKFLLKDNIPSMHTQIRLASGQHIWLHALHPEPPSPTEADASTDRDAELLIVGKAIKDRDNPTIVAGDLNDVAWSYTTTLFQKTSGLLDPRRGRGFYNTFNAKNFLMRWPLDHVFHSDHFTLVEMQRPPAFGSDHFPIYVNLHLQAEAQSEQEEPEADQGEKQQTEEKIEKATEQEPLEQ
ncbi:MAG TPA: endonuclease/exonuclease/phosphatase family protein [Rhodothermales bacterium]|nr:endonuclease/exonuclease/phosphatase family protein [Rhodothermales bacterium]